MLNSVYKLSVLADPVNGEQNSATEITGSHCRATLLSRRRVHSVVKEEEGKGNYVGGVCFCILLGEGVERNSRVNSTDCVFVYGARFYVC